MFISDSVRLDLIAALECQYKVVIIDDDDRDSNNQSKFQYAIGLAKNSDFLRLFNVALEQLKQNGRLQTLIEQHWTDYCIQTMASSSSTASSLTASTLNKFLKESRNYNVNDDQEERIKKNKDYIYQEESNITDSNENNDDDDYHSDEEMTNGQQPKQRHTTMLLMIMMMLLRVY